MKAKAEKNVQEYTPWETIQEQYPDKFVLMKDLVRSEYGRFIGGTVVYAHKDREKVINKDVELQINRTMMLYTRGIRGDRALNAFRFI
jgi:hypothetical protein